MSFDVLQQFRPGEERRALAEMARVVKPGGLLALRVSAFRALRSRHSEFVRERQRYTRPQLRRLVEDAGFRILRATYANTLLSPVALLKFRLVEPLQSKRAESGIQPEPQWLDRALYGALAAEAAWLRAGFNLPFGQSLLLIGEKHLTFPSLSVFFPAYNDAPSLPALIAKTFETLAENVADYEVIVVNDGSRDETGAGVGNARAPLCALSAHRDA